MIKHTHFSIELYDFIDSCMPYCISSTAEWWVDAVNNVVGFP